MMTATAPMPISMTSVLPARVNDKKTRIMMRPRRY